MSATRLLLPHELRTRRLVTETARAFRFGPGGARSRGRAQAGRYPRQARRPVGPLHGIPLAVKDIIATKTMPTTCGSPIYRDHVVGKDAACVTQLVKAGAIVLGKSVTTEFAGGHAGKTHNPHNLRHTPAGSSSGSAAAVADFMAPIGYGTQTAGSVIRPGAFNGVVAYKGTFGWADMTGIKPYAPTPRHAGLLRPRGQRPRPGPRRLRPRPGRSAESAPPRIGLCRTLWWDEVEPSNQKNLETGGAHPARGRRRVRSWEMPESWQALLPAQNRIMTQEATKAYARERARFPHLISPSLTLALATGDEVSRRQLAQAKRTKRRTLADLLRRVAALRLPAGAVGQGRGAVGPGLHRRSAVQPLLDAVGRALHRPALQQRPVRPAAVGAAGRSVALRRSS